MDKEKIKALIEEIRLSGTKELVYFPWEYVFDSMLNYPEKVCLSYETCPDCGEQLIQVYFSSPSWTWEQLCGRAGDMLICPKCHEQKDFFLRIMN